MIRNNVEDVSVGFEEDKPDDKVAHDKERNI